jgi:aminopeptidase N
MKNSIALVVVFVLSFVNANAQSIYSQFSEHNRPYIDSLENDVLNYKINNLQIIPEQKLIRASAEIKILKKDNRDSIHLDFHHSFKIQKLTVNGQKAKYKLATNDILTIDISKINVENNFYEIFVSYYNTKENKELWVQTISESNFHFVNLPNKLLYPCIDYIGERATYEIDFILPDGYEIITYNTNENDDEDLNKGKYISLARLTPNNLSISLVKDYSYFEEKIKGVDVRQYSPIDTAFIFKDRTKGIAEKINFIQDVIGYYPFQVFNIVITKDDYSKLYNVGRNQLFMPFEFYLDDDLSDGLILNGLSQQWFGNKISVKYDEDLWISEGFSRYMEWLWAEKNLSEQEFRKKILSMYVEIEKYIGNRKWESVNPNPFYKFDTHYLGIPELEDRMLNGLELENLFKTIYMKDGSLTKEDSVDFKTKFNFDLGSFKNNNARSLEIVTWMQSRGPNKFKASADSYFTFLSILHNKKYTKQFTLTHKPHFEHIIDREIYRNKSAMVFHYIRIKYGDELFFNEFSKLITQNAGGKLTTRTLIYYTITTAPEEIRAELRRDLDIWLNQKNKLPSLY